MYRKAVGVASRGRTRQAHCGFRGVSNPSPTENQDTASRPVPGRVSPHLRTKPDMATSIAPSQPSLGAEYSYRDQLLVVTRGSPLPPGATPTPSGINFVLLC